MIVTATAIFGQHYEACHNDEYDEISGSGVWFMLIVCTTIDVLIASALSGVIL